MLSHTLGAVGHYTSEFISFSTYSTGKFFPKYENLNTILQSNATPTVTPTVTPTITPTSAPSIFNNSKNSSLHHQGRIYDFEFAYDVGILALSDEILRDHKFKIVNVTLSGKNSLLLFCVCYVMLCYVLLLSWSLLNAVLFSAFFLFYTVVVPYYIVLY